MACGGSLWRNEVLPATVDNEGNVNTWPQLYFTMTGNGGATVVIRNTTTGQQITLDLSSCGALQFWLLPESGEILKSTDRSNKYSFKKVATEFLANLYLVPGNNVWTISNTTGMNLASCGIYWKHAFA